MAKPRLTTLRPRLQSVESRVKTLASAGSWRAGKTTTERGYGSKWQRAREEFLREHPLCVLCEEKDGLPVPATVVDHITPHRGDQGLFWDRKNWRPLCKPHHDSDAQRKDNQIP
ncbi:HNH endonuclease signature motif containing protein [Variovorax sp. Varisp41]|uniref:HNH endonuclease signature motif containing protein n=1 Tax=Variovorax sp. Varisp41 TaxID=3243033 RepID=UPI0039B42FDA